MMMRAVSVSALAAWLVVGAACSSSPSEEAAAPPATPGEDASVSPDPTPGDASTDEGGAAREAGVAPGPVAVERATIAKRATPCTSAPADFGYGPVTQYDRYEVANPAWIGGDGAMPVVVLAPVGGAATHPVIFFSHPFGGNDWTRMRGLLEVLVSNDHVVVFTPYATKGATVCQRYDTLWGGFTRAVDLLRDAARMDTTRTGFVGHSFGGGATPFMAHQGITTKGWGSTGAFLFSSAPWYGYEMTAADWADFPPAARLAVMVYADDAVNDHRMAIGELFEPFPRAKSYLTLVSAENGSCKLVADHGAPMSSADPGAVDALDTWGVWRQVLALSACTLRNDATACAVADGTAPAATAMGTWTQGGAAVPPVTRSIAPTPAKPESGYVFPLGKRSMYPCDRDTP